MTNILLLVCIPIGYLMLVGSVFSNLSLPKAMLVGFSGIGIMMIPVVVGVVCK